MIKGMWKLISAKFKNDLDFFEAIDTCDITIGGYNMKDLEVCP